MIFSRKRLQVIFTIWCEVSSASRKPLKFPNFGFICLLVIAILYIWSCILCFGSSLQELEKMTVISRSRLSWKCNEGIACMCLIWSEIYCRYDRRRHKLFCSDQKQLLISWFIIYFLALYVEVDGYLCLYCSTFSASSFPSEVITYEQWVQLKPGPKSMLSGWMKSAFGGGKKEMQGSVQQTLDFILSTAPIWDRLVAICFWWILA